MLTLFKLKYEKCFPLSLQTKTILQNSIHKIKVQNSHNLISKGNVFRKLLDSKQVKLKESVNTYKILFYIVV